MTTKQEEGTQTIGEVIDYLKGQLRSQKAKEMLETVIDNIQDQIIIAFQDDNLALEKTVRVQRWIYGTAGLLVGLMVGLLV